MNRKNVSYLDAYQGNVTPILWSSALLARVGVWQEPVFHTS